MKELKIWKPDVGEKTKDALAAMQAAARAALLYEPNTEETMARAREWIRDAAEKADWGECDGGRAEVRTDVWDGVRDELAEESSSYGEYKLKCASAGKPPSDERTYKIRHSLQSFDQVLVTVTIPPKTGATGAATLALKVG